jgi:hypothetical protein
MRKTDIEKLELVRKTFLMQPETARKVKQYALQNGMRERGVVERALQAFFKQQSTIAS